MTASAPIASTSPVARVETCDESTLHSRTFTLELPQLIVNTFMRGLRRSGPDCGHQGKLILEQARDQETLPHAFPAQSADAARLGWIGQERVDSRHPVFLVGCGEAAFAVGHLHRDVADATGDERRPFPQGRDDQPEALPDRPLDHDRRAGLEGVDFEVANAGEVARRREYWDRGPPPL